MLVSPWPATLLVMTVLLLVACACGVADTLDFAFDSDPVGSILRLSGFDVGCDPTDAGTGVAAVLEVAVGFGIVEFEVCGMAVVGELEVATSFSCAP